MKIYTKTGDAGQTGLFGGVRVAKDDDLVEAYGTVDELNALVGVVRSLRPSEVVDEGLLRIQGELFRLGAELSAVPTSRGKLGVSLIESVDIVRLEQAIDSAEEDLPPLTSFVLPGGAAVAAALHHARTVCRRAERSVIHAQRAQELRQELAVYLNRLSDLLFVWARYENQQQGSVDVPWLGRNAGPPVER